MIKNRPAPLRTDGSNDFAHHTMRVRIPGIIQETLDLNPDFTPQIQSALTALQTALVEDAPLPMLHLPAPDYEDWLAAYQSRAGETWLGTDWFFAEIYVYRLLMEAVRWWETERDPFAPKKAAEYATDALWGLLARGLEVSGPLDEQLATLLELALWGNRMDLSYSLAASHGSATQDDDLLVDERALAVRHLLDRSGPVHIITDNAGTELTMDLVLADALLHRAQVEQVVLHLKWHPTFVSDATVADVLGFVEQLQQRGLADFGQRLRVALETGQLRLAPDAYWNSTRFLWDMPPRLVPVFSGARLTIIKGDVNYRRMVGDAVWSPTTPMAAVAAYFPGPLLALRSLKSDPVVGLPAGLSERMDAQDDQWRVNGRRGLIQMNRESEA